MTTRYKLAANIYAEIVFFADDGYPHEFVDEFNARLRTALHEVGVPEPRLDISVNDVTPDPPAPVPLPVREDLP